MRIKIKKDANIKKEPIIIEGFPGFGLVGTIATEYLIDHLKTRIVGEFDFPELPATTAIHKGSVVRPMALHYSDEKNILIFHTILNVHNHEWEAANEVLRIAEEYGAKEIISLEGVNSLSDNENALFSYGNPRFVQQGAKAMSESIIMGVTAALLLKSEKTSCLFAQTSSGLPDSKAASAIITLLDKYLDLNVDPQPLLQQASQFEEKLKGILQQTQKSMSEAEKKNLSYLG